MSGFNMPPGVSQSELPGNDDDWCEEGDMQAVAVMTLRDYFAAKAMQALVSQRCYPYDKNVGIYAYMIAGTMLKARAQ